MYDVSVLMFTHRPKCSRRHKYIVDALASLRKQQGLKVQAIILDDGSSAKIPKPLISDTKNVDFTYQYFPKNRGKHTMMDMGLPMIKAPIMTTLHDDDFLYNSESLKIRLDCFNSKPNTALIWTDAIYRRGKQKWRRSKRIPSPSEVTHAQLLKRNIISGATYLIRTDLKQRFRAHKSLEHAEEYDIWLQVAKYARDNELSLRYCPKITGVYRLHSEQNWDKVRRKGQKWRNRKYENGIRERNK